MAYTLPDPTKQSDWHKCLILSYKTLKGVAYDDRTWDQIHFGECIRSAKKILQATGSLRLADEALVEISKKIEEMGRSWNLHTVARWVYEWTEEKGLRRKDVTTCRKGFFDALANRGATPSAAPDGKDAPDQPLSDGLRSVPDVQPETRKHRRGAGKLHGKPLERVLEIEKF